MLFLAMLWFGCAAKNRKLTELTDKSLENWVCVYSEHASPDEIRKFDLAVLDSDAHPDLTALRNEGTILLGYVSLAEAGEYRWFWPRLAGKEWLVAKNPNWDSWMIDVRSQEWQQIVLNEIIPRVIGKGFNGLFLDTIDTAEYLEKWHPGEKVPGAQAGLIELVKQIRKKYPHIYLVANRGFSMLDQLGPYLDGLVAESVFTTVDFGEHRTVMRPKNQYESNLIQLRAARKKFKLLVFTLDYVDAGLERQIPDIIAMARAEGFLPFISTPQLDTVYHYTLEQ